MYSVTLAYHLILLEKTTSNVSYDKLDNRGGKTVALENTEGGTTCDQAGTPSYNDNCPTFSVARQHSGSQKPSKMKKNLRRQQGQVSKLMIFSLVVMISGFIIATPFSLLFTLPAYILADKVSYYNINVFESSELY